MRIYYLNWSEFAFLLKTEKEKTITVKAFGEQHLNLYKFCIL
jgi:hypothetical protein